MKKLLILLLCLFLSACSVFSPVKTEPSTTYLITTVPEPLIRRSAHPHNILVTQPESSSIYNTTGIAYTTHPYQIAYFVKSTWAETPAQMLHPLIIETLRKTKFFRQVGSVSGTGRYLYILNTQLLQLQQDFTRIPPVVHFILRAEIVNAARNQVIASQDFAVDEMIRQNSTYSGVLASNRAAALLLNQLASFCVKSVRRAS